MTNVRDTTTLTNNQLSQVVWVSYQACECVSKIVNKSVSVPNIVVL